MTIDPRTRAAVDDLWASTVADPDAGLATLFQTHARRRRQRRAGLVAATAVALGVAWWGGANLPRNSGAVPKPARAPSSTQPAPANPFATCNTPRITCEGSRTYGFALVDPVQWHIPAPFGVNSGSGALPLIVESYWRHRGNDAGVSVLERVHAAAHTHTPAAAPGVPATAHGFIAWLASRPFVDASTPRPTTLAGHPAWQVRVSLNAASAGPGRCSVQGFLCHPVTFQKGGAITGLFGDVVADYTAVDLANGNTTVVWSWAFGHDHAALDRNRALVDGVSWPGS